MGSDRHVEEDDTLKAKSALNQIGYYKKPDYGMTPYPDQTLFDGIKNFQKDQNLTIDGLMTPGGETEIRMNKLAEGLEDWKAKEIVRLTKEIKSLEKDIARKKVENRDETDPNQRAANHYLIRNLEEELRQLRDELHQVTTTREV